MPHNPENYMANRYKKGTVEHLWHKWFNKLWKSYSKHALSPRGEPPSFMRDEFIRDIELYYFKKYESILKEIKKDYKRN